MLSVTIRFTLMHSLCGQERGSPLRDLLERDCPSYLTRWLYLQP